MKDRSRILHPRTDESTLLIKGCRIWAPGGFREASILIVNGKIARIARSIPKNGARLLRADRKLALPGMIDPHVHLRDMELSYKEDFRTGTEAAAAGGFTTVLDMPNTRPATDSPRLLREKIVRARRRIVTNVGFHVAAIVDSKEAIEMHRLGAFSMKLYMPRPITPLDLNDHNTVLSLFRTCHRLRLPLTVHAEDPDLLHSPGRSEIASPEALAAGRPENAETSAVENVLDLARKTRAKVHFCHLTLPQSIRSIRRAGITATSEVTPHHLLLSSSTLRKKGWKAWMVPPLRDEMIRFRLFRLVMGNQVDLIASDHAPHTIREKSSRTTEPPPGVPGLETTLPLMLTLVNKGYMSIHRLIRMCSTRPAQIFGLESKGVLAEGLDADITIVNLKKEARVRADRFFSKARYSPFEGTTTRGSVVTTVVNGEVVFDQGEIVAPSGAGRIITRDGHS